jgi:hypothetical protein
MWHRAFAPEYKGRPATSGSNSVYFLWSHNLTVLAINTLGTR